MAYLHLTTTLSPPLCSILEYFNKWAFVYVGLYVSTQYLCHLLAFINYLPHKHRSFNLQGYSYIEAGKSVITLFKNRGWEAIIADDLIGNVFFFISLCVGGLCAAFGLIFEQTNPEWFENAPISTSVGAQCAGLGFVVGLVLTSIMMSTIASAVNTVIVCFAEGPAEFEANHPELSRKMRETWLAFYPNCGV